MLTIIKNEIKYIDKYYFVIIFLSIISIFAYAKFICNNKKIKKDVFEYDLFPNSGKLGIDGWSLTHYILYFFFGFLYPKVFFVSILLGTLWELAETIAGVYVAKFNPDIIKYFGICNLSEKKKNTKIIRYTVWFYGKWSDIVVNALGFISGMVLHNYLN